MKLKTFVAVAAILLALLVASVQFARTIYISDVTEVWVQPPFHEASYVVGVYNSTFYYAKNGTTGEMEFIGTDLATVINSAISALGTNGGTIYLKDVQLPAGVTIPNQILIIEDYQGKRKYYGDVQPTDIYYYRRVGTTAPVVWYTSPNTGTAMTTGAPTVNVLRAMPFIASQRITLDRIGIRVTTAGAGGTGKGRLGIYADDGNLYPGSLVIDAGEVTVTAAAAVSLTIDVTLNPGLYWLVYVHDCATTAPTIRCFAVGSLIPILGAADMVTAGTAWAFGYSVSFTYAALPSTFPTGASLITAIPLPVIWVRLSA